MNLTYGTQFPIWRKALHLLYGNGGSCGASLWDISTIHMPACIHLANKAYQQLSIRCLLVYHAKCDWALKLCQARHYKTH